MDTHVDQEFNTTSKGRPVVFQITSIARQRKLSDGRLWTQTTYGNMNRKLHRESWMRWLHTYGRGHPICKRGLSHRRWIFAERVEVTEVRGRRGAYQLPSLLAWPTSRRQRRRPTAVSSRPWWAYLTGRRWRSWRKRCSAGCGAAVFLFPV